MQTFGQPLFFITIFILGIVFFVVLQKVIIENRLNKQLHLKQKELRVHRSNISVTRPTTINKVVFAFTPILIFTLILFATIDFFGKTNNLLDIVAIHTDFENNYLYYNADVVDPNIPEANQVGIEGDDYNDALSSSSEDDRSLFVESLGTVFDEKYTSFIDGDTIYNIEDNTIGIFSFDKNTFGKIEINNHKTIDIYDNFYGLDLLEFNGVFVVGDTLVVTARYDGELAPTQENRDSWLFSSQNTVLMLYKITDNYRFMDEYILSGKLTDIHFWNNNIYLFTNNEIDFLSESVDTEMYLPHYKHNNLEKSLNIDELFYNEGTNPNAINSLFSLDLSSGAIDIVGLLGDSSVKTYFAYDGLYLFYNKFYPASDFGKEDTTIVKIHLNGSDLVYETDSVIEGKAKDQTFLNNLNNDISFLIDGNENTYLVSLNSDLDIAQKMELSLQDCNIYQLDKYYLMNYDMSEDFNKFTIKIYNETSLSYSQELSSISINNPLTNMDLSNVLDTSYSITNQELEKIISVKMDIAFLSDISNEIEYRTVVLFFSYSNVLNIEYQGTVSFDATHPNHVLMSDRFVYFISEPSITISAIENPDIVLYELDK